MLSSVIAFVALLDEHFNLAIRLSILVKLLTDAYAWVRSWLFDLLPFVVPPLVQDALVIGSLVFVALNLESLRRTRRPWVISLVRHAITFARDKNDAEKRYFQNLYIYAIVPVISFVIACIYIATSVSGSIDIPFLNRLEADSLLYQSAIAGGLFVASASILIAIFFSMAFLLEDVNCVVDPKTKEKACDDRIDTIDPLPLRIIFYIYLVVVALGVVAAAFMTVLISSIITSLFRSWRSIGLLAGGLCALIGLNFLFLNYLDPILLDPPPALRDLINADLSRLVEDR
ncbi:hypothetical protein DDZ18_06690 [Marinicauda salina]|uniref:Uncharacterized protein n=2 Tax=Marinicauda salina TaxID=2135793 RepID=A0A2U2BTN0_9PROT|nr:hypothetical protein DDZ18_06690 [Marinicauda salina]